MRERKEYKSPSVFDRQSGARERVVEIKQNFGEWRPRDRF